MDESANRECAITCDLTPRTRSIRVTWVIGQSGSLTLRGSSCDRKVPSSPRGVLNPNRGFVEHKVRTYSTGYVENRSLNFMRGTLLPQLVRESRIHNYLRMLWGKKILERTKYPHLGDDAGAWTTSRVRGRGNCSASRCWRTKRMPPD